jgi:hypothetical protein
LGSKQIIDREEYAPAGRTSNSRSPDQCSFTGRGREGVRAVPARQEKEVTAEGRDVPGVPLRRARHGSPAPDARQRGQVPNRSGRRPRLAITAGSRSGG